MTIPECIEFLITSLVQLLSSSVVFPFVGVAIRAYVITLVLIALVITFFKIIRFVIGGFKI